MDNVTKHNTPALRFEGFDGEWDTKVFGAVVTRSSTTSAEPALPRLEYEDIISGVGVLNKDLNRKESLKEGLLFGPGDVLYGKLRPYLKNWLRPDFHGIAVGDFWVLQSLTADPSFLYQLIQTPMFDAITSVSSGSKMPRADWKLVSQAPMAFPSIPEEQRAIGELFSDLDALIEQHRAKHMNLQQTKTALLQRMFPRDGTDEPELRLDGFSGAWEIQPFSDLVAYRGHNSLSRADLTEVPTSAMNIHYGDILVKYDSVVDVSQTDIPFVRDVERLSNVSRQSLSDGDVLFADAAEDSTVGKCVEVQGISDNLVIAGLHTISARPVRAFAPGFLGHALNAPSFHNQLLSKMQGTKVSSISISTLAETVFSFPTLEEQRAIGEVFSDLDALIAAEHRYITQLTRAKTALLQRMFV